MQQARTAKQIKKIERQINQLAKEYNLAMEEWKQQVRALNPDAEKFFDDAKQLFQVRCGLQKALINITEAVEYDNCNRFVAQQRKHRYGQIITLKPTGNINTSFHVEGILSNEDDWAFSVEVTKTAYDHKIGKTQTFRKENWEEVKA